jgi:hypothetical protein
MSVTSSSLQQTMELAELDAELSAGLERFWQEAAIILKGGAINLVPPDRTWFSLSKNFFSALFLYSYLRSDIPKERRILYVAINQCLRGLVTGCDNILDDEYKTTLETNLPPQAHRFRSVVDIMVADRVLFALLSEYCHQQHLPIELALRANNACLGALARSGTQEASEEGGVDQRLLPEKVLTDVHHFKTGILFQSPWVVPTLLEPPLAPAAQKVQRSLYRIGIGCQLLDDIVDLFSDIAGRRHNYVTSVIAYQESPEVWESLQSAIGGRETLADFYATHPGVIARVKQEAMAMLRKGLSTLFLEEHQHLVDPASAFVADRIGGLSPG